MAFIQVSGGSNKTCSIDMFRAGVSDRDVSIRIPTQEHERGYLEDRRLITAHIWFVKNIRHGL